MPNPNLPIAGDYNVYVGARYVPLIMGQWSETVAYEPLSVVVYEGNSYTSRTFVPAGVPVTNETYWAATGNYNAQVEQYRQEVQQVSQTVNDLQEKVDEIAGNSSLQERKFIFIGDSYNTTDTPAGGVPIVPWSTELVNLLKIPQQNYYNTGRSGSGFVHTPTFLSQLQALNIPKPQEITDIVVLGGINDGNQSNVKTAVLTFCNYCRETYPNAKVHVGVISWVKGNNKYLFTSNIIPGWSAAAEVEGCFYVDNLYLPMHDYRNMQPDGHPNSAGSRKIALTVANYLKSGHPIETYASSTGALTLDSNIASANVSFTQYMSNGMAYGTVLETGRITFTNPIEGNQDIKIGTIPEGYLDGLGVSTSSLALGGYIVDTDNVTHPSSGIIYLNGNQLRVRFYQPSTTSVKEMFLGSTLLCYPLLIS